MKKIELDGQSLTFHFLKAIEKGAEIGIADAARLKINESREVVEKILAKKNPVYGINTGFGYFSREAISREQQKQLQKNLIVSHASGIAPYLTEEQARIAMVLRLNVLVKGFTGVRVELCEALCALINFGITPLIPQKGSVGASGDLVPLAHLALPLIGEGNVRYKGSTMSAREALKKVGLEPIELQEKEGLSLINGTQLMLTVGSTALIEGLKLLELSEQITALTYEGMCASTQPLYLPLHEVRGHIGQVTSAKRIQHALIGSYLMEADHKPRKVQDAYSLRCAPQVHGASRDALDYVTRVFETELNGATDNPLVFTEEEKVVSGGNFHGQPLAITLDFAAIAMSELGNISERRLEQLLNPHTSDLAAFLVKEEGLCSGYMTLQYMAASRVNENKVFSHPASTDSIPGNVGVEDHVSMGPTAGWKLTQIIDNTYVILACELLAAAQAISLREITQLGETTKQLFNGLRKLVSPLDEDRLIAQDVEHAVNFLKTGGFYAQNEDKNF